MLASQSSDAQEGQRKRDEVCRSKARGAAWGASTLKQPRSPSALALPNGRPRDLPTDTGKGP